MSFTGSVLQQFWSECGDCRIHPADKPFFDFDATRAEQDRLAASFKTDEYGPWPFDGPLHSAKVVVCYANALYAPEDVQHRDCIRAQRTGAEDLPYPWAHYYIPRIGRALGMDMSQLRRVVSVFNICPYPSVNMPERAIRFAAGLPSVWAAQKHLREVLIPKALAGDIFLVMARKHQLWGVTDGFACDNIAFSRNMGGHLGPTLGGRIRAWFDWQHKPARE
jgi:hypothetical protein